jgi:hypothetical protein
MKINEIVPETSAVLNSNRKEKNPSIDLDFQNILKEAQAKTNDFGPKLSATSLGEPQKSTQNYLLHAPSTGVSSGPDNVAEARLQGIRFTEKALELLEAYQKSMADLEVPLKEIDPMIQSLSKEIDALDKLSKSLPPSDPLQKILTEAGILSTVEIEKFKRGEYI